MICCDAHEKASDPKSRNDDILFDLLDYIHCEAEDGRIERYIYMRIGKKPLLKKLIG